MYKIKVHLIFESGRTYFVKDIFYARIPVAGDWINIQLPDVDVMVKTVGLMPNPTRNQAVAFVTVFENTADPEGSLDFNSLENQGWNKF